MLWYQMTSQQAPMVARTVAELKTQLADLRIKRPSALVVFVPTMGALHDGHRALMTQASHYNGISVASIFVNPTQFGPNEDLAKYPRTWEADLQLCADEGIDVVFAPTVDQMYGDNPESTLSAGPLGARLEGAQRPGHFDGVVTVVAKLFDMVHPNRAIFGQKDAQQVAVIRAMVRDLELPVEIEAFPTVRDSDGLAMSSRNVYLSDTERAQALVISRALVAADHAGSEGAQAVLEAATNELACESEVHVRYVELVHPDTLEPVSPTFHGDALLLVAAMVGTTRLIDNSMVRVG
jgi:pantoate--beta-alanine ligase